jgi:hypothetical protein
MSKQVRLRRGTTAQHASFTGADGEVTFDTTKKVLVLHDGATPGGKPLEGFLKLDPGDPTATQELKGCLHISGGDSESTALVVDHYASFNFDVNFGAPVWLGSIGRNILLLGYASSVRLDFLAGSFFMVNLTGNVAFTTTNLSAGRVGMLKIAADNSARTLAFPVGWRWLGGAAPATLAANKVALVEMVSSGSTDGEILARAWVEA